MKSIPLPPAEELSAAELIALDHRHIWHPFTPMYA